MSKKTLLNEASVRKFMKFAKIDRYADNFINETYAPMEEEEAMEEGVHADDKMEEGVHADDKMEEGMYAEEEEGMEPMGDDMPADDAPEMDDEGGAMEGTVDLDAFMDAFETDEQNQNKFLAKLGPEPTPDYLTPMDLADALRGRKTPMKSALLDQSTVAGLGNIYVCEILFRSGISPKRSAASVAGKSGVSKRVERVTAAIHDVITEAIDAGGSTISDFVNVDGDLGYFSHSFQVYGREGETCVSEGCKSTIKRIVQSGRSTFYCADCQR